MGRRQGRGERGHKGERKLRVGRVGQGRKGRCDDRVGSSHSGWIQVRGEGASDAGTPPTRARPWRRRRSVSAAGGSAARRGGGWRAGSPKSATLARADALLGDPPRGWPRFPAGGKTARGPGARPPTPAVRPVRDGLGVAQLGLSSRRSTLLSDESAIATSITRSFARETTHHWNRRFGQTHLPVSQWQPIRCPRWQLCNRTGRSVHERRGMQK